MKHAQENTEALLRLVTVLPMACERTSYTYEYV
jgi:hypothetical protein